MASCLARHRRGPGVLTAGLVIVWRGKYCEFTVRNVPDCKLTVGKGLNYLGPYLHSGTFQTVGKGLNNLGARLKPLPHPSLRRAPKLSTVRNVPECR